jgi:hypothetical protein
VLVVDGGWMGDDRRTGYRHIAFILWPIFAGYLRAPVLRATINYIDRQVIGISKQHPRRNRLV